MTNIKLRKNKTAISLVEILIAFVILTFSAMGLFQAFRGSGIRGESFSSEHLTAMFLCQKIVEDINLRLSENPHFFSQLIKSAETGEKLSITDGESFLFKIWQNSKNNGNLDFIDDGPITKESGPIFKQLKGFKLLFTTAFAPHTVSEDPSFNVIELNISIFWNDSAGKEQKYELKHILSGYNEDSHDKSRESIETEISEVQLGNAIWNFTYTASPPSSNVFTEFMNTNGGNELTIKQIAAMVVSINTIGKVMDTFNNKIEDMEKLRDAALAKGTPGSRQTASILQWRIAEKYNDKASMMFLLLGRMNPYIKALSAGSISDSDLGNTLKERKKKIKYFCSLGASQIELLKINLDKAIEQYETLFKAPHSEYFPNRKQNPTVRSILNAAKLRILLESNGSPFINAHYQNLKNLLDFFFNMYKGKQPFFIEFLEREKEISATVSALRIFYGTNNGLTVISDEIVQLKNLFIQIEASLVID
ncbi:MAG: hypothetical protein HQM10_03185 [Candidatus Riflebacteria bacterium]|nr:hypothetical protein [Candidatus Riflebacteria bacterium]